MRLLKLQIALVLACFCFTGFSQKSYDINYKVYYRKGDISPYQKVMQFRLQALGIELLNCKVDTAARTIDFDVKTKLDPNSLEPLFTVDNKFGFYSTIHRDSLKKLVSNEYYLSVALNVSKVPEHTHISDEIIGYADSFYFHKINNTQILASTLYKDAQLNKHLIYFIDQSNPPVPGLSISGIEIKKDQNNTYYYLCLKLNDAGSTQWSQFTESNINKTVAIMVDQIIVSAPIVQSKITGGRICMVLEDKNDAEIFKNILSFSEYYLDIEKIEVAYILDL